MAMNQRLLRPVETGLKITAPTDLPNLALWLDASNVTSLFDANVGGANPTTNLQAIGRWQDLSGNSRHVTQGTANSRPQYITNSRNGNSGLRFDAVDDVMISSAFACTVPFSIFCVHIVTNVPANSVSRVYEHGGNNGITLSATGNGVNYAIQINTDSTDADVALASGTPKILQFDCSNASPRVLTLRSGNTFGTGRTSTGTPTTPLAFHINRFGGGGFFMGQTMYEIVYYDTLLTTLQSQAVRNYLSTKWDIPL